MKVYNKTQADFESLVDYNNYLEEVEDLIYNIVNNEPNAEECKAQIKKHEETYKNEIAIRQSERLAEERLIQDKIANEQRENDRKRRLFIQEEKLRKVMKARYHKEATEVQLGERDVISKEVMDAHLSGYKITIKDSQLHKNVGKGGGLLSMIGHGPRVREPHTGLRNEPKMDREFYLKRQTAGGGVPSHSEEAQDRTWNMTVTTLFC